MMKQYIESIIIHVYHWCFCKRIKNLQKRRKITEICLRKFFKKFGKVFENFGVRYGIVSIFMENIYLCFCMPKARQNFSHDFKSPFLDIKITIVAVFRIFFDDFQNFEKFQREVILIGGSSPSYPFIPRYALA